VGTHSPRPASAATVKLNSLPGHELARPYDYGPALHSFTKVG